MQAIAIDIRLTLLLAFSKLFRYDRLSYLDRSNTQYNLNRSSYYRYKILQKFKLIGLLKDKIEKSLFL